MQDQLVRRSQEEVQVLVLQLEKEHGEDRVCDALNYGGLEDLLLEGNDAQEALEEALWNV